MLHEDLEVFYRPFKMISPGQLYFQDIKAKKLTHISKHPHGLLLEKLLKGLSDNVAPEIPLETTHSEFLDIYSNIASNGFSVEHPVQIAIDEQGVGVILDGLHRTICALHLGLDVIPVQIVYRALNWQLFKHAVYLQNGRAHMYQYIEHFDFEGWSRWRVDNEKRAQVVAQELDRLLGSKRGQARGLELACNSGAVSCSLSRRGYSMLGLDVEQTCVDTASYLAGMRFFGGFDEDKGVSNAHFETCGYVVDLTKYGSFDFILCFSLLNHHQVDGRDEEGKEIFRRLVQGSPLVFLDCPTKGDPVGGNTDFVRPERVIEWCRASGAMGEGRVVALHEEHSPLMRTIIIWER